MVAQSEVEKLREELNRVRAEGGGNLFGKNILLRLVGWLVVQLVDCWFCHPPCVALMDQVFSYIVTQGKGIEEPKS